MRNGIAALVHISDIDSYERSLSARRMQPLDPRIELERSF
jgi:hypothetical protein